MFQLNKYTSNLTRGRYLIQVRNQCCYRRKIRNPNLIWSNLEIEERGVGLPPNELEGAEEYTNADSDAIGEKEGLTEVANGVSDTWLVGAMIAGRRFHAEVLLSMSGSPALPALELLDGVAEALLRFAKTALGVGIVGRRRRGWCHGSGIELQPHHCLISNPITPR